MKVKYLFFVIVFVLVLIYGTIIYTPNVSKSEEYLESPTVFIHGYKGTYNSFGNMLKRYENEYRWGRKAFVYHVSSEGKIRVTQLKQRRGEPVYIQVIFENNRASFADNAKWLAQVLHHMKENYEMDSINLVGHSMGGIISVKCIEDYYDTNKLPLINKLVTIGSPFDGIYNQNYFQIHHDAAANDLRPNSKALTLIKENRASFPRNISVLSIGSIGDIVAVPDSVKALQAIIPKDQLHEVMINDQKLGHSALHESKEVDFMIHNFLFPE